MSEKKQELQVAALENGTVIEHNNRFQSQKQEAGNKRHYQNSG